MKQNRQSRIVAIIALSLSVVGLTLGFAAFSNTLTISSSATVKPDQKDFKMVAYGLEDTSEEFSTIIWTPELFTSSTLSKAKANKDYITATDAKIESAFSENGSNNITISNLNPTFTNPGDGAGYYFLIKNEGKYDAYLAKDNFNYAAQNKVCEPVIKEGQETATNALVQEACKSMVIDVNIYNSDGLMMNINEYGSSDLQLPKYVDDEDYGYAIVAVSLSYTKTGARADGEFTVKFPDINMEFSTVPKVE